MIMYVSKLVLFVSIRTPVMNPFDLTNNSIISNFTNYDPRRDSIFMTQLASEDRSHKMAAKALPKPDCKQGVSNHACVEREGLPPTVEDVSLVDQKGHSLANERKSGCSEETRILQETLLQDGQATSESHLGFGWHLDDGSKEYFHSKYGQNLRANQAFDHSLESLLEKGQQRQGGAAKNGRGEYVKRLMTPVEDSGTAVGGLSSEDADEPLTLDDLIVGKKVSQFSESYGTSESSTLPLNLLESTNGASGSERLSSTPKHNVRSQQTAEKLVFTPSPISSRSMASTTLILAQSSLPESFIPLSPSPAKFQSKCDSPCCQKSSVTFVKGENSEAGEISVSAKKDGGDPTAVLAKDGHCLGIQTKATDKCSADKTLSACPNVDSLSKPKERRLTRAPSDSSLVPSAKRHAGGESRGLMQNPVKARRYSSDTHLSCAQPEMPRLKGYLKPTFAKPSVPQKVAKRPIDKTNQEPLESPKKKSRISVGAKDRKEVVLAKANKAEKEVVLPKAKTEKEPPASSSLGQSAPQAGNKAPLPKQLKSTRPATTKPPSLRKQGKLLFI